MKARGRGRLLVLLGVLALVAGAVLWLRMDFKRPLVAAVRGADRVAVDLRPPWDRGKEPPPFVLEGRDRIEAFLETLDFQFSLRTLLPLHCRCLGDLAIDFREGDSTVATLTYHHGTHLRWRDGPWGSDVYLTPDSRTRLDGWLRDQGYDRLEARREARREWAMPEDVETAKFYGYFPKGRIEDPKGDGKETATAVFRAFSVVSRAWGVTGDKERRAIEALSKVGDTDLLAALDAIEDDREALLGFARFFFFHGYDEEAILVFERITGQVVWNRAPRSRPSWFKDAALAWWKENGEAFVRERRAARTREKQAER